MKVVYEDGGRDCVLYGELDYMNHKFIGIIPDNDDSGAELRKTKLKSADPGVDGQDVHVVVHIRLDRVVKLEQHYLEGDLELGKE